MEVAEGAEEDAEGAVEDAVVRTSGGRGRGQDRGREGDRDRPEAGAPDLLGKGGLGLALRK